MTNRINLKELPDDKDELMSILAEAKAKIEDADKEISEGRETELIRRRRFFWIRVRAKVLIKLRPPNSVVDREKIKVERAKLAQENIRKHAEIALMAAERKAANVALSQSTYSVKLKAVLKLIRKTSPELYDRAIAEMKKIECEMQLPVKVKDLHP